MRPVRHADYVVHQAVGQFFIKHLAEPQHALVKARGLLPAGHRLRDVREYREHALKARDGLFQALDERHGHGVRTFQHSLQHVQVYPVRHIARGRAVVVEAQVPEMLIGPGIVLGAEGHVVVAEVPARPALAYRALGGVREADELEQGRLLLVFEHGVLRRARFEPIDGRHGLLVQAAAADLGQLHLARKKGQTLFELGHTDADTFDTNVFQGCTSA